MLKNNLLLALRHLWRNKMYTAINILGLSIGITAFLVIALIARYELSFDTFRVDRDQIYRVYSEFSGVFSGQNRGIGTAVAPWVDEHVSGVAYKAQFFTTGATASPLNPQGKAMDEARQSDIAVVEPDYFSVFSDYQWLSGDPESALAEPNQVVITAKKAGQYFGVVNPVDALGRQIQYGDASILTVSGILADLPDNTDLYFNDFVSMATVESGNWVQKYKLNDLGSTNSNSQLFLKLLPGKQADDIDAQLVALEQQYEAEHKEHGFIVNYKIQPFNKLHFSPAEIGIFDQSRSPAHLPTLYLLIGVAVLLLLVAAINFINLETAQSIRRAREIGVRKVLGGSKEALVGQFMGQTFLLTAFAMIFALFMAKFSFYYFADFMPPNLTFDPFSPQVLLFALGTTVLVALIAGTYPAFVLSAYRPALALKDRIGVFGKGGGSHNLRRGLVIFQFVIAQVLIFGSLAVGHQINYLLHKDMGFSKDAIVYLNLPWRDTSQKYLLAEELKRWPEISNISLHGSPPAESGYSSSVIKFQKDGEELSHNVFRKFGDTSYVHLYDLHLLAGRNIQPSDTVKEMIINETYARQLGFQKPAEAIGQYLEYNDKKVPIVGLVQDFHFRSLHQVIEPVAIADDHSSYGTLGLKLATGSTSGTQLESLLARLEEQWKRFYPDNNFHYEFLDEAIANFYESEQRTAKLVRTATLIAILISCLGLFGLVSFAANQRTKEIGIRKVLGATVSSIVGLLSREFLLLVIVAFALATPFAWWATRQWLGDFAYHIHLSWWLFALCGGLGLLVAFLTMSVQAIRAALNNPVDSLKSE
ncbi:MAG: FtsX-like permease family protein [Saprospiraceae bacterium]